MKFACFKNATPRKVAAAVALLAIAPFAQAGVVGEKAYDNSTDLVSTVVVQDTALGGGLNNPRYLPPVTDSNYSGVVNLWFRNASGEVESGCTGSLLTNRTVLTAAHCVATNSNTVDFASFTARFRNPDGTVTEVNGTGFAVQAGYSGAVVEEQDVAVLTLSSDAPRTARHYSLFTGNPLQRFNIAGYGLLGTGTNGVQFNSDQFSAGLNTLRAGVNRFETTGNDGQFYEGFGDPTLGSFGGVLRADMDRSGQTSHPTNNFMCGVIGFCDLGEGLDEVALGQGDSGGAAFESASWQVLGVASWGQGPTVNNFPRLGRYGSSFGYACVANFADNASCLANYNFVMNNTVPEPGTLAIAGLGLLGVAGFARRRKVKQA
jgi:hypothetical protein